MGHVRNVFSITTGKDVLAATFGMSAALWGPKLAGFGLWAPLGRGYGGVATSVVSSVVASTITSFVSPSRARITLISGLAVSFAGLLSAIHCGWRTQVLPFETGLLACAMPTMPGPSVTPGSPAALALAAGTPIAQVRAMGLPGLADYVTVPRGMAGYGGGNAAGVSALLANEQAFRRAAGVNDYATFQTSESSKGMDASPETF